MTARLTVLLCTLLSLFWLQDEALSFIFAYHSARETIVDNLMDLGELRAEHESRRYRIAEQDARNLLTRWQHHQHIGLDHHASSQTRFLPDSDRLQSDELGRDTTRIVDTFGISDLYEYADTFVVLPGRGMAIHQPANADAGYLTARRKELLNLASMPVSQGLRWGQPSYDPQVGWRVSVAAVDERSGVMAGFALRLSEWAELNQELAGPHAVVLLRDASGMLLPIPRNPIPEADTAAIGKAFSSCGTGPSKTVGAYHVVCRPLAGPGWQMLMVYADADIRQEAYMPFLYRLPLGLLELVGLLFVLYQLLRYCLVRPIRQFVSTLDQLGPGALHARMPDERYDELGHIARAYNSLLNTIELHYDSVERKVMERTRELDEAKHRAELANQRKSEHVTNISHEIRTPLNGVVGALDLLRQDALLPSQYQLVDTALACSGYLLEIINNLLDLSRIEAGQMELSITMTELLPVLDEAVATVSCKAREKALRLEVRVAPRTPLTLPIDALRVRQILINLLGNAVKFTQTGTVRLLASANEQYLYLAVEDSGPGIDPKLRQYIFQPFFQAGTQGNGSGLGLTISSQLAALMGGRIEHGDAPGGGSRFCLRLPLHDCPNRLSLLSGLVEAPAALHEQLRLWGMVPVANEGGLLSAPELPYQPGRLWALLGDQGGGQAILPAKHELGSPWCMTILLVDDVATNRDITGQMLRALGHQVLMAHAGEEALDLGRRHVIDIVVMDVQMPGMDGIETARRWRDENSGVLDPDCPIIALSANALLSERIRAEAAGMSGYLTKPVTLAELRVAVDQSLQFQLRRGIELNPNPALQMPMLSWSRAFGQLKAELSAMLSSAVEAVRAGNADQLQRRLHAIKGVAGQGGLTALMEASESLERQLAQTDRLEASDFDEVARLIEQLPGK